MDLPRARAAFRTRGLAQLRATGAYVAGSAFTLADVAVWDWAVGPVARHRDALARSLHERVFAWMTLGDERNLVTSYVQGVPRHARA